MGISQRVKLKGLEKAVSFYPEPEIYEGVGAVYTRDGINYTDHNVTYQKIKQAQEAEKPLFSGIADVNLQTRGYVQTSDNLARPFAETFAGQKDEPALRYDAGKPRYDLLPADGLEELVNVYTVGAKKYADRNWEKGMSWSRCFGSLLRHSWKFWRGELIDPETGCHHMAHVAWNAIALVCYSMRSVGTDDRPLNKLGKILSYGGEDVRVPTADDDVRGALKF